MRGMSRGAVKIKVTGPARSGLTTVRVIIERALRDAGYEVDCKFQTNEEELTHKQASKLVDPSLLNQERRFRVVTKEKTVVSRPRRTRDGLLPNHMKPRRIIKDRTNE